MPGKMLRVTTCRQCYWCDPIPFSYSPTSKGTCGHPQRKGARPIVPLSESPPDDCPLEDVPEQLGRIDPDAFWDFFWPQLQAYKRGDDPCAGEFAWRIQSFVEHNLGLDDPPPDAPQTASDDRPPAGSEGVTMMERPAARIGDEPIKLDVGMYSDGISIRITGALYVVLDRNEAQKLQDLIEKTLAAVDYLRMDDAVREARK